MSRPIVQVQQQGGLHLFNSAFLLSIMKAYGDHYQNSPGQQGNDPTGSWKRPPQCPGLVLQYAMYHRGDLQLGTSLVQLLQSQ